MHEKFPVNSIIQRFATATRPCKCLSQLLQECMACDSAYELLAKYCWSARSCVNACSVSAVRGVVFLSVERSLL